MMRAPVDKAEVGHDLSRVCQYPSVDDYFGSCEMPPALREDAGIVDIRGCRDAPIWRVEQSMQLEAAAADEVPKPITCLDDLTPRFKPAESLTTCSRCSWICCAIALCAETDRKPCLAFLAAPAASLSTSAVTDAADALEALRAAPAGPWSPLRESDDGLVTLDIARVAVESGPEVSRVAPSIQVTGRVGQPEPAVGKTIGITNAACAAVPECSSNLKD